MMSLRRNNSRKSMPIDGSLDNFFQIIFFHLAANRMASCDCALHAKSPIRPVHFGRCSDTDVSTIATFASGWVFIYYSSHIALHARVLCIKWANVSKLAYSETGNPQDGLLSQVPWIRDAESTVGHIEYRIDGQLITTRTGPCDRLQNWTDNHKTAEAIIAKRAEGNKATPWTCMHRIAHAFVSCVLRWPDTNKKTPLCWSSSYNRANVVWS